MPAPAALLAGAVVDERSPDAQWAAIGRGIPGGFGGLVMGDNGRWELLLVDTKARDSAVAAFAALPNTPYGRPDLSTASVRQVRWTFAELYDWYRVVIPQVARGEVGLSMTDIDELNNRIFIGLVDNASVDAVISRLEAQGIPCNLVVVAIKPRPSAG